MAKARTVICMTYNERIVLKHEEWLEEDCLLEQYFVDHHMTNLLPLYDADYRINADIQMVYTTSAAAGAPNLVATRILCDKLVAETPALSDDIDMFQYMPHGPVVFLTTLDYETFRNQWSLMFRSKMPYEKLMARLPPETNYYNLYRACSTDVHCAHSILVHDFGIHVPVLGVKLSQWSQAECCVMAACIIRRFAVDWPKYSNLNAM